ncbi:MAG: GNAT family N-acetyltransferase [Streptomycetaceae bacterium]|nr:GNAT family N-acetyltransferase [Streptomycetaceae bacterium]
MAIDDVSLTHYGGEEAVLLLEELCDAYADAYGVEPGEKTAAFRRRAEKQFTRPGFALVAARVEGRLVGFVFGYALSAGDTRWWGGVQPEPTAEFLEETGSRTWVLSEIEVRRAWQGRGIGRALNDAVLGARGEERATLATGPNAPAQRVYEAWGWQRVGRIPGAESEYYSVYELFVLELPVSR